MAAAGLNISVLDKLFKDLLLKVPVAQQDEFYQINTTWFRSGHLLHITTHSVQTANEQFAKLEELKCNAQSIVIGQDKTELYVLY